MKLENAKIHDFASPRFFGPPKRDILKTKKITRHYADFDFRVCFLKRKSTILEDDYNAKPWNLSTRKIPKKVTISPFILDLKAKS